MNITPTIIAFIISYLIGSVTLSIAISKRMGRGDIRNFGSHATGATNVLRTLGKKAAAITFVWDILKGVICVVAARVIGLNPEVAAFGAILGHIFPVYFGFKGGKGVATTVGIILSLYPLPGVCALIIALAIMAVTKYVSLGSIIGVMVLPLMLWVFKGDAHQIIFAGVLAIIVIITHRQNIDRLIHGVENKLGQKVSTKVTTEEQKEN
ncbi:MAG: glycerol-3-phosphate 1-O-acyltransferase PlsY [Clostridiales bacterium]|jgi:glycerol-3-phosphate acyltransferase PlsY|nr:glycerol-3-phosphate 1-O-acyltransferase PlsY [Clostridiales bacterium]